MLRVFTWCLSNIKSTLAIIGFLITMIFIPTLKEGIAFINAGYQSTKDNVRQDSEIRRIGDNQIKIITTLESIEKTVNNIENRDYDELRERRKKR